MSCMPFSFPPEVEQVFCKVSVPLPARLVAHLHLVYEMGNMLLEAMDARWNLARMSIDPSLVQFGTATHDIGKTVCQNELFEEGHEHEKCGYTLLRSLGVGEEKAKFAKNHASWAEDSSFEALVVSLADKIWKGSRIQNLEDLVVTNIAEKTGRPIWEVFAEFDSLLQQLANNADERVLWQNQYAIS